MTLSWMNKPADQDGQLLETTQVLCKNYKANFIRLPFYNMQKEVALPKNKCSNAGLFSGVSGLIAQTEQLSIIGVNFLKLLTLCSLSFWPIKSRSIKQTHSFGFG